MFGAAALYLIRVVFGLYSDHLRIGIIEQSIFTNFRPDNSWSEIGKYLYIVCPTSIDDPKQVRIWSEGKVNLDVGFRSDANEME
ncbi:hypothetical protein [Sphingobacterium sp.]|uniref:hypothetical protein n=1 Tax=Sphingobacterium sp. TaxID=341027 RepID=UPI0028993B8A|nr:hypothetical protein [Sphingobacterium sp.]